VLAGPYLPEGDFANLKALAAGISSRFDVIRSIPDLPAHLAGARVSVSQAGYNTVADILVAGCAAVLAPFASGGETEQTMRAEALATSGRAAVVSEDNLYPESIAAAISQAVSLPQATVMQLDGGPRTAACLLAELARKNTQGSTSKKPVETRSSLLPSFAGEHP
jgi:predicted glycosyltransferase